MERPSRQQAALDAAADPANAAAHAAARPATPPRINSRDLFQHLREVEIEHDGRIYRLRVTQLNKLILTA